MTASRHKRRTRVERRNRERKAEERRAKRRTVTVLRFVGSGVETERLLGNVGETPARLLKKLRRGSRPKRVRQCEPGTTFAQWCAAHPEFAISTERVHAGSLAVGPDARIVSESMIVSPFNGPKPPPGP